MTDGPRNRATDMLTRSTDGLADHPAATHDVEVTALAELDPGVFKVERAGGDPWVARVFPAARPLAEVEGDAVILRGLERAGFPAERCATASPVSRLDGQGVLVTGFVPANALDTGDGVTIVDWTGAGRGPRLWSLGFLLFAAGARSPKAVDARQAFAA